MSLQCVEPLLAHYNNKLMLQIDSFTMLLNNHSQVLLKRFALGFKVLEIQSDLTPDSSISRAHSLLSLCSVLLPLYVCRPGQQEEAGRMVANLVRSCTPAELLDALLDVLHKRVNAFLQNYEYK